MCALYADISFCFLKCFVHGLQTLKSFQLPADCISHMGLKLSLKNMKRFSVRKYDQIKNSARFKTCLWQDGLLP